MQRQWRRDSPGSPLPSRAEETVRSILASADIRVDGDRPWDVQVHDPRFYGRLLAGGSLAAGEAYMDGWWDVDSLDQFFARIDRADPYLRFGHWAVLWLLVKGRIINRQTVARAPSVAHTHYDLGNDLYESMLERHMQYTCAYWKNAETLERAQENKLDLICRKLQLAPGLRVLELGGGFGGLARFIASRYGCEVVSYNISAEQVAYGRTLCNGLPVRFERKDYREAMTEPARFQRVAAVGLCEHIGYKNYAQFFEVASRTLEDRGLFLVHTIGSNQSTTATDPWIDKYIFPNGNLPSIAQFGAAMEGHWVVEDWHNFGPDYDRTLLAWWRNFDQAWPALEPRYGARFYRMWKYYLLACAGRFRARKMQLWQIVLSKGDIPSYTPVR